MLAELLELIPPFLLPDDRQELLQTLGGKKRKMRFFLNTSILLDVLERRHPFFHSASHLCGP